MVDEEVAVLKALSFALGFILTMAVLAAASVVCCGDSGAPPVGCYLVVDSLGGEHVSVDPPEVQQRGELSGVYYENEREAGWVLDPVVIVYDRSCDDGQLAAGVLR